MTDPVPDISQPPTLRGVFDALTPGGTDGDALMKALKSSRRPTIRLRPPDDADPSHLVWCRVCERTHDSRVLCPESQDADQGYSPQHGPAEPDAAPAGRASASLPGLPADPFTPGSMADAATAEWFHGLVEAGIPVESVERIIGHMFAQLVIARERPPDAE